MMMKRLRFLLIGLPLIFTLGATAQDDRTLVTIDGENVSVDEFMYVYKKNNTQENMMDKKSIEDYLDLFINFKLKVKEAERLGMDTVKAFKDELAGYRRQLAEPYFTDTTMKDKLLKEAWDRMQWDIRASHILFRVGPDAMPADTLAAYKKAMAARARIMAGEPFEKVAKDVSEDPSARDRENPRGGRMIPGNGGDLGYFSVFDMVYPFETGAYNTPVGEVSMPIRSDFGYHLIKVTDKIPAQGTIEAAHLFLQMPDSATAEDSAKVKKEAFELYDKIQNGAKFEDLVKEYSDDKGSATRGGLLPKFQVNRMVHEFIQAISQMKDSGDISKPVLTSYGWHIIKLINKTGVPSYKDAKADLEKRLEKDRRAQKSTEVIIQDIKKEYGYKAFPKALDAIYAIADSSLYEGKWQVPDEAKLNKTLISLGDSNYTQKEFARYIAKKQNINAQQKIDEFINQKFKAFSKDKCRAYEDSRLEEKYPDFRAIVREYRDGILLFDLTNEKIWTYAGKDTVGLHNYHDEHVEDFMWDNRLDASLIYVLDTNYTDQVKKLAMQGMSDKEIEKEVDNDSLHVIRIEHKKYQKEDNKLIDAVKWKKGTVEVMSDKGKPVIVVVHEKIGPEPKTFDEARGLITAGYQDWLEKKWIKELRAKYPVVIHQDVLESLVKK